MGRAMEKVETITEAVELLLDKAAAQESLIFLLAHYVIDTGTVSAAELADHIRGYEMPTDTSGVRQLREFYAAVIGGDRPRPSLMKGGREDRKPAADPMRRPTKT